MILWLRGVHMVLCVGVPLSGYRRMLGLMMYSQEDEARLTNLLQGMVRRGLSTEKGMLYILPSAREQPEDNQHDWES